MSQHPVNQALRFLLELALLVAIGIWGWKLTNGWLRYGAAVGFPLLAAVLWGVFRVPNDPGPAPVPVPGLVRLAYELALFAFATWALFNAGYPTFGWVFGVLVVLHYLTAYDRVVWLLKQ